MNIFAGIRPSLYALTFVCLFASGCQNDFLTENSISTLTTDAYYKTPAGFEDLVKSCYPLLRNIHQARVLVLNGTDIFAAKSGWSAPQNVQSSPLDAYDVRFNASLPDLQNLWRILYTEIGRTNTVVSRAGQVEGMDETLKNVRVGEAKFLRALCYFYLVQQWGDVPMPLQETTGASKEAIRIASAEIYKQIIADLTECEGKLPEKASDYGRVTKGAVQFLLARVYLTRGWNFNNALGGSSGDFDSALQYADKVIGAYPLAAFYNQLFPKRSENPLKQYKGAQDDKNPEIIFSVQYSSNTIINRTDPAFTFDTDGGNNLHSVFPGIGGDCEGCLGGEYAGSIGRTSDYNRYSNAHITTPAAYRLFDPQLDSRYDHNFVEAVYALAPVKNFNPILNNKDLKIDIAAGDTVVYFPAWNQPATASGDRGIDVGGKKHYSVINTSEIGGAYTKNSGFGNPENMMMWKFWEPNIPYGDAFGTFNEAVFRSAEAYLIAAEAIVKGAKNGKLGGAEVYYNKVLDRALTQKGADPKCAENPGDASSLKAVSYRATAANISIDLILDERARELMGEYSRWFDLKRTGKLIERVNRLNPWRSKGIQITDKHYLRPIPQGEIDLSYPAMTQNTGY